MRIKNTLSQRESMSLSLSSKILVLCSNQIPMNKTKDTIPQNLVLKYVIGHKTLVSQSPHKNLNDLLQIVPNPRMMEKRTSIVITDDLVENRFAWDDPQGIKWPNQFIIDIGSQGETLKDVQQGCQVANSIDSRSLIFL